MNYERNRKDYLFSKKEDGSIYEVEDIKKKHLKNEFIKKHLIFALSESFTPAEKHPPEVIKNYLLTSIIKSNFHKEKESISLMDEGLDTETCRQMLSVGTKAQKEIVKNLFLTDNRIEALPFSPEDFPNLRWITLSKFSLI